MQFKCTKELRGYIEMKHTKSPRKFTVLKNGTVTRNDIPELTEWHIQQALQDLEGQVKYGTIIAIDLDEVPPTPPPEPEPTPEGIQRTPVTSSNLISVGYDAENSILEVEFKTGGIYQYNGVPKQTHMDMITAPSIGGFFAANVRDSFPCKKAN